MVDSSKLSASQLNVTKKFNQELKYRFSDDVFVEDVVTGIRFTKFILNIKEDRLEELSKHKASFAVLTEKCSNVEFCIENEHICIYVQNDDFNEKDILLKELLNSKEFLNYKVGLPFPVGKDFYGNNIIADLRKLSHLLCVGFVGSGTGVFDLESNMILSFASKYAPSELKFLLIEPKNYGLKTFEVFNELPHLLGSQVFKENQEILDALSDVVSEINRRVDFLSEMGAPSIDVYNNSDLVKNGKYKKMPYVVIVINKFENVISINPSKIERMVQILTGRAKSCGFNLVIGTEKATDDVLTNIIVKHVHSKVFFKTKSISSKYVRILPESDNLFVHGDMYFLPFGETKPTRIQSAFIDYNDYSLLIDSIRKNYK